MSIPNLEFAFCFQGITHPINSRQDHALYALKNAKDIPALKAVGQNLMHANLSITDGVYGILSENDVREQIYTLGKQIDSDNVKQIDLLISLTKELLEKVGG